MTFNMFLFLGVVFVVSLIIVLFNKKYSDNEYSKWIYMGFLVIYGICAVITLNKYLNPKTIKAYDSSDYHVLEHLGFSFDKELQLVSHTATYEYPHISLWDNKYGDVKIIRNKEQFILTVKEFLEPFYVSKKEKGTYFFTLINNIIDTDVSDGFELRQNDSLIFQFKIVPSEKNKVHYISSSGSSQNGDTSIFHKPIFLGYPLMDILLRTPNLNLSDELLQILDGALLVRHDIDVKDIKSGSQVKESKSSPLRLFIGENFYYKNGLSINDFKLTETSVKKRFVDTLFSGSLFYSGVGLSRTDIYRINGVDSNKIVIKYVLPKMHRLNKGSGQTATPNESILNLFLTSSIEEVTNSKMRAGYLYNIFEIDTNYFHFNGRLRYCIGSARDSMYFEITDLESVNPSEKFIVPANQEFAFNTKSNLNNPHWLFQVEELRATNTLRWEHIFWFISIFISMVCLRIIFSKSLSILELSIYVVVFCFGVIRLILTWRMSTFPPIEDIEPAVFFKMHDGLEEAKWTFSILILPPFFILIAYWLDFKDFLNEKFTPRSRLTLDLKENKDADHDKNTFNVKYDNWYLKWQRCPVNKRLWLIITLYSVLLSICGAISIWGILSRFMNIPIPILLFFVFSYWLKIIYKAEGCNTLIKRIQNTILSVLALGYFAIFDSGFAIIFCLYLVTHWGIVALWCNTYRVWKTINILGKEIEIEKIIYSILFLCLAITFLYYEGNVLLFIFERTDIVLGITCIIFALIALYIKKAGDELEHRTKRILIGFTLITSIASFSLGAVEFTKIWNPVSEFLNTSKNHVKYRAKAQKPEITISDMMRESNFDSNNMEYIMRSAHNQWFINEYNAAASNNKGYWTLQPHFNQGSTYPTQTTDLVVVRYILAEHGLMVLIWLMVLLLLLLIIYAHDVRLDKTESFTILGTFILLFSIALFVCLSANNKIVFFGQDFPFLSLTSKMAVFFPIALFVLAVWHRILNYYDDGSLDNADVQTGKIGLACVIIVFTTASVLLLPTKGKSSSEENDMLRFNVSAIINETSNKIAEIDRDLQKYQHTLENIDRIPRDTIWKRFNERSTVWKNSIDNKNDMFFSSLLEHFNAPTTYKYNPEEFLHLRVRNGYLHLAVNRKYYFIRSFRDKHLQWTGDLKAAKSDKIFNFTKRGKTSYDTYKAEIVPNIFKHDKVAFRDLVSNVSLMRIDSSWTADKTPIYLISSEQGKSSHQYFDIVGDKYVNIGFAGSSQLAARLLPNDRMTLKRKDDNKEKIIETWKYGENDERYLAKNIWLNGRQRLFYPLGKISIWTYHFANLVNHTYGNEENIQFRDSTIRISIDYDLTEKIYKIVHNDNNKPKSGISLESENRLLTFMDLTLEDKVRRQNNSLFYYNLEDRKVYLKSSNIKNKEDLEKGVAFINKELRKLYAKGASAYETNSKINEAIDKALEKRYDYSAVILDGNGRIRALFDYSKLNKPDPNNILHYNRFLSDMYKESTIRSEIEYLGNKTLQLLVPGPGSSFKPIAYTAVTSQAKIDWKNLDLDIRQPDPKKIHKRDQTPKVAYYGGLEFDKLDLKYWDLAYNSGKKHNEYLIHSNNLYHSVMILLGAQTRSTLENNFNSLLKRSDFTPLSFPIINYNGKVLSFNPETWYGKGNLNENFDVSIDDAVLNLGMKNNFNLKPNTVEGDVFYNGFGSKNYLSILFKSKQSFNYTWAFPSTGSLNNADRNEQPYLRNGLIQMSLGANPLEVSPLQMATFGMRLATLNRAGNITTLSDDATFPEYKLFHFNNAWDSTAYFSFYTSQVLSQLRHVPTIGTAKALKTLVTNYKNNYYFYVKTGTLNITDKGDERIKHLLVIISNTPLENIKTAAKLRESKYYVLYLTFYGIGKNEFSSEGFDNYNKIIEATIQSEQFKKYMSSK